nr:hypothetical protein BaRGS_029293 [Batillaria attramentaria]
MFVFVVSADRRLLLTYQSEKLLDQLLKKRVQCYFDSGFADTPVYLLEKLGAGHHITGPAIIIDKNSTILVEPGCEAEITQYGDISITVGCIKTKDVDTQLDAIQLSIFSHRFMSIAEQMGRVLQRTSISTNIKERLDFSCALFGPDGGLVANAPHIPVHLGAMQETVQYQMRTLGDDIRDGDVILSNHPQAGGSHLPDLTVITPENAEVAVRDMLREIARKTRTRTGTTTLSASDRMDDGSTIGLCVDINEKEGCMNNITFGDETLGYYETVAGGSGADVFRLETPGGGGYGKPSSTGSTVTVPATESQTFIQRGSLYEYKLGQESA